MSARYESATRDRPGVFRFDPSTWKEETRGGAEIVSVHEGYPGHHLQISIAREATPLHPVSKLAFNSAYVEGWARYAEALAEELGIYSTDAALIERRSWPARGMITDPALHVLGWSDEEVKAVLIESGRFNEVTAERALDRISVLPAQLTSYDSGALELFALRKMAEEALGEEFDLKTFHGKVLEDGILPLWMLRQKIESWLKEAG
ncbi:MAG: DUF885 family protein [Sphingomonadales bacterium]